MSVVRCIGRASVAVLLLASSLSAYFDMAPFFWKARVVTRVPAVVGGEAVLPCDIRPPQPTDSMTIFVWYKNDVPVYSYQSELEGLAAHWAEDEFRERYQYVTSPSGLRVVDVQISDRDIYMCRVEFTKSQTRNLWVSLDVIELPSKPVISDEFGKEILRKAGPYNEGSEFKLICSVKGGVPSPRIQWQRDNTTLASTGPVQPLTKLITSTTGAGDLGTGHTTSLALLVKNASRDHLSSTFTCITDNTRLAPPQQTTVMVDLFLRPLVVEILSAEQPLAAGRRAALWCRSAGARPAANLSWHLGSQTLESITKFSGPEDANETRSLLLWVPSKQNNGQVAVCRANHFKFNAIESKLPLNIHYAPEPAIHLGAKLNPNDIEEGDDVYFGCRVDANPPPYKVLWEHDGVHIQHNPSNGVIVTGSSNLVLRNVTRLQAGLYSCTASNLEGDTMSALLRLSVIYKPVCKVQETQVQGAAVQEPVSVECQVEAYPRPDSFEWTLNSSAGSTKVDPDRFTMETNKNRSSGRSVLTYTPLSESDYGTLSCRASNLAGQQVAPCLTTLLPATRPDPPTNCTIYNLTHDSMDLLCVAGYEGGLQSVYIAEVWAKEGLAVNATSGAPQWELRRLGAGRRLRLRLYAANARGRSARVALTAQTAPPRPPTTEAREAWELNWAAGMLVGAVLAVSLVLCLALLAVRLRRRSRDYEVSLPPLTNQKIIAQKRNIHGADEHNPDLIPPSKEFSENFPQPPPYAGEVALTARPADVALVARPADVALSPRHHSHLQRSPSASISHSYYTNSQIELVHNMDIGQRKFPWEVVTTRTPLLACQQESRV